MSDQLIAAWRRVADRQDGPPSHHDWWPADPAVVPAASVVEVVAS